MMNYSTSFRSVLLPLIIIGLSGAAYSAQEEWVKPQQLIVDKSLPQAQFSRE